MRIVLHSGIDNILFGMSIKEVEERLGTSSHSQTETIDDTEITIMEFHDLELSLCFERKASDTVEILSDITPYSETTSLWDTPIYHLSKKQLQDLCSANGLNDLEIENDFNAELMLFSPSGSIAFFFEQDELISISFGR